MIKLHDLEFEPFLSEEAIQTEVKRLAETIFEDYQNKKPVFVGVLNGAFMFLSDLMKHYPGDCEVSFMRLQSYEGTESTGKVKSIYGLEELNGKDIILVEDIIDTGNTLVEILSQVQQTKVNSYKIASLFQKPDVYSKDIQLDYIGLEIPNRFIVGYGLDYNGLGRNLPEIYQLKA
ncbi:MAG: hypoxanthine phosphoribosyltransferase [Bacteroidota bacterium]